MSNIAMQGGATGTGTVTLLAPVTSTNRTLTLPDSTGTVATAESTLTQFNASGSAPVYACRAWVNFNGTGVVAIRASGNVSSITDGGTGTYTVNFTTAMPDADYAAQASVGSDSGAAAIIYNTFYSTAHTASGFKFLTTNLAGSDTDFAFVMATVFR